MSLRLALVAVLLLSTVVFAWGVSLEHAAEPDSDETILGINPEAPALVTAAIALSVLVAVGLLLLPVILVLATAGVFGLGFSAVDILEILRQLEEHRLPLAAIALTTTLFHLTIPVLAVILMRRSSAGAGRSKW